MFPGGDAIKYIESMEQGLGPLSAPCATWFYYNPVIVNTVAASPPGETGVLPAAATAARTSLPNDGDTR